MKKILFVGILTLSMILALSACKGNVSEEAVTPDPAATEPQVAPAAPSEEASNGET